MLLEATYRTIVKGLLCVGRDSKTGGYKVLDNDGGVDMPLQYDETEQRIAYAEMAIERLVQNPWPWPNTGRSG